MTLSPFMVYLAMQADSLRFSLVFAMVACGFGVFLFGFFGLLEDSGWAQRIARNLIIAFVVCMAVRAFLPSTKTIAAMVILPPVVNNEQVQALPADILGFVRGLIREYTPKEGEAKL